MASTPASVMRNVCSPGTDAWPRSFIIWSFRTIEFRSITGSANVKTEMPVPLRATKLPAPRVRRTI